MRCRSTVARTLIVTPLWEIEVLTRTPRLAGPRILLPNISSKLYIWISRGRRGPYMSNLALMGRLD